MEGFPAPLLTKLEHIVLSHHGEKGFGSPVESAIPEAILFHFLDNMDSKLAAVRRAIEQEHVECGWTERIPALGRSILCQVASGR
jgi:3'-5' exoribonuclease